MLKEGDKHRWGGDGGGRRYGTPTRRRKCWVEGGGWVMGVRGTGFFFSFAVRTRERMRDGDPVQVHRIQERKKHAGGLVGVVRWYRTITGVGGTGGGVGGVGGRGEGWEVWSTCLVTYKFI